MSKFALMTFGASINRYVGAIPLLLVILAGALLRFYKIREGFPFDFDQEYAANSAYDFFVNHKVTLIGQELSFKGFYLGPLHNWIQFIPYKFCSLLPDCVPYFYAILGTITIPILYIVIRSIFDAKTALISTIIYSVSFAQISYEWGVNSNYFLFLSSIGLMYSIYQYFRRKSIFLIIGAFIAGIATVNFNPVFIFSAVAFILTAFLRERKNYFYFVLAVAAFLLNFLPLIIFNFRHDNILWENFLKFISQNAGSQNYFNKSIYLVRNINLPFFANYLFQSANTIFLIFILCLVVLGTYFLLKKKNNLFFIFPVWLFLPVFGFLFYKGHIPDYYLLQSLLPFIIIISFVIRKNFLIFLIFITFFLFMNIKSNINYKSVINYRIKKEAVTYVIRDSAQDTFNVHYSLPLAINNGYPFLFKALGKGPQEGGGNLYVFGFDEPSYYLKIKYERSFPAKTVSIGFDHFIKIVKIHQVN